MGLIEDVDGHTVLAGALPRTGRETRGWPNAESDSMANVAEAAPGAAHQPTTRIGVPRS